MRVDELAGMEFVHGSPRDEDEYLLNASTANANFRVPGHPDIMMFGHTHLQGGFVYQEGRTHSTRARLRQHGRRRGVDPDAYAGGALSH